MRRYFPLRVLSALRSPLSPLRWLPALAWTLLIFWLSAQSYLPGPPDPLWRFLFMKMAHLLAYGTLALLYLWGLGSPRQRGVALLLVLLWAISDEWHQSFTPGRTATPRDVLIDITGAALALGIWPQLPWAIAKRVRS